MPSSIIADLLDCMPDTLVAQPGTLDETGGFIPSGSALNLQCLIEGEARLVRDASGREVTSSVQCYIGGAFNLTTDKHRYTLPSRFIPNSLLRAISIGKMSDENGAHHEVVMLP